MLTNEPCEENPIREISKTASIRSANATYTEKHIVASYQYETVDVVNDATDATAMTLTAIPKTRTLQFLTERRIPQVGVMLVGLGGNNGTTFMGGLLANQRRLKWRTKQGIKESNWYGSLMLASTSKLGVHRDTGRPVYVPLNAMLPMLHPDALVVSGWDISAMPLGDAMRRAEVLDLGLQDQLYDDMQKIHPLPGIHLPHYIASNQNDRADNVLSGTMQQQLERIRQDIRDFRSVYHLEKVIVLWTATTERFSEIIPGIHDSQANLLNAIQQNSKNVAPSTIYAVAAILEQCSYINGSPQNTCVPGVLELAASHCVFLCGDDFKSGQTKLKSTLVDFLISAGLKPMSIVSYNHLGNNDGKNLSSEPQFRSKEITKSNVIDDMIENNPILYAPGETPDHCVVIKYIPYVGDSKRALDEYTSEIFLNGTNTLVIHNTCEDSLLAAPIMLDLILLTELCERITIKDLVHSTLEKSQGERFHTILSLLGYLCKAPLHPPHTPIVNSLFAQRHAIVNVLRACLGLPPDNFMDLEFRVPSLMRDGMKGSENNLPVFELN